jgi:ubiquinone/menaquinone biosynthesis C-methylase UbiE
MLDAATAAGLPHLTDERRPSLMPDLKDIYAAEAERYDQLVTREDYRHNLLPAIQQVRPLAGLDVVELGAGTGRLTCLLAPFVKSLQACDASPAMLAVARARLNQMGATNWQTHVADHGHLPLAAGSADLAISGWSFCYAALDHPDHWRETLGQALSEVRRVLRSNGTFIILETLGTGFAVPHPPDTLKDYLAYLDGHGFRSTWLRTDYQFTSLAEAENLVRFFFGDELARQTVQENWVILPECTGLWWQ